ncbi:hypothetical protein AcV7_004591 [Taiwanofungus camphoratus]|nr:hypothetical protein AcV7_004591 [Antrodia cinnamomea]
MVAFNISLDDSSPLIIYSPSNAWVDTPGGDSLSPSYSQASLHTTCLDGATASITFNGTGIWLYGGHRPNYGSYTLSVDGSVILHANASSTEPITRQLLGGLTGFSMGEHTVVLANAGNGSVDLDSLVFETHMGGAGAHLTNLTLDDTNTKIMYGPAASDWVSANSSGFYNNTLHYTETPGAQASLGFSGAAVAVYGTVSPEHGNYTVTLDGQVSRLISGGNARTLHSQYFAENLGPQEHFLVLTGMDAGKYTDLDYVTVYSELNGSDDVEVGAASAGAGAGSVAPSATSVNMPVGSPTVVLSDVPASSSGNTLGVTSMSGPGSSSSSSSDSVPTATSSSSESSILSSTSGLSSISSKAVVLSAISTSDPSSSSRPSATYSSTSASGTGPSSSMSPSPTASSSASTSLIPSTSAGPNGMVNPSVDQENANNGAAGADIAASSRLSKGALVGIVIGSALGFLLLMLLLFFLLRRGRGHTRQARRSMNQIAASPVLPIQDPDLEAAYEYSQVQHGADGFAIHRRMTTRTVRTTTTRWSQASYDSSSTLGQHQPPKWNTPEPEPTLTLRDSSHSSESSTIVGNEYTDVPLRQSLDAPRPAPPRPPRPPSLHLYPVDYIGS